MSSTAGQPPLTAAEAEAIATAIALHHLRASSAGGPSGPAPDAWTGWARAGMLSNLEREPHPTAVWGVGTVPPRG